MRFRVLVEYDGSEFGGWQRQARRRSVQGELEAALADVTGEVSDVVGSGRTDAGVHAAGQVAHFDSGWGKSAAELQRALNARLARDVVVIDLEPAPPDFHARYSATSRLYEYRIWNAATRPALDRRTCWHVPVPLDERRLAEACTRFPGEHDFAAFGQPLTAGGSTVRRVTLCRAMRTDTGFLVSVEGNAFLRRQVRRMVGLLADIGLGRLEVAAVTSALRCEPGAPTPRTAPAQGLVLVAVRYE